MKKWIAIILLTAAGSSFAQELHTFSNGDVADAEKINENFNTLKETVDNLPADTSCSIEKSDGMVTISCPDGTAASLADDPAAATCTEADFAGIWVVSDPNSDIANTANLSFYYIYEDNFFSEFSYDCTFDGCSEYTQYDGEWGSLVPEFCRIEVLASVSSEGSAWGWLYLSQSKTSLTGFICDGVGGCAAGTINKWAEIPAAKPSASDVATIKRK